MRFSNVPLVAGVAFALVSTGSVVYADAKVEAGATIYGDYCSSCHGEQLRNTSGGVTFDLRRLRPEDRDRFDKAVLDGKGPMPPWRGVLRMEQVDAIWAYIRATVDR
jgi:mono/diheme cytochrome c family protein